jgi:hypothetical protein
MGHFPVKWNIAFEEIFRLFYLPNPQPGTFVDLMLKKNRHKTDFKDEIEDFRIKIAELNAGRKVSPLFSGGNFKICHRDPIR